MVSSEGACAAYHQYRRRPDRVSGMAEQGAPRATAADVEAWSCPAPLHPGEQVVMGHGGGGRLSAELVEHLFLPAFGEAAATATPTDAAVLELPGGLRLAFTTDTYVVQPLRFPGGDIGELAVYGTVNDLAMSGAAPVALSSAFVLEEGLELEAPDRDRVRRWAGRRGAPGSAWSPATPKSSSADTATAST